MFEKNFRKKLFWLTFFGVLTSCKYLFVSYVFGGLVKNIKLSISFVLLSLFGQVECMKVAKDFVHWQHAKVLGFKEISEKSYPKTLAYFEMLRLKYPKALKGVKIVISPVAGPMASSYNIMFPLAWIEELEKETEKTQLVVEWVILHEAGHIYHSHVAKIVTAQWAALALLAGSYIAISKDNPKYKLSYLQMFGAYLATSVVLSIGHIIYSRNLMEPQADDFANELCDNPLAFIEAAKWFDRVAFDGMTHPPYESRVAKMEQAMQAKFGMSLEA